MNLAVRPALPPLLDRAFPPAGLTSEETALLAALQAVIDSDIAPRAAENDARGRYPTESIAALKRAGILKASVPVELGGFGARHRVILEAQVRLGAADSAVCQIFKIHDEIQREVYAGAPAEAAQRYARKVLDENAIFGLAAAESGRRVDDLLTTHSQAHPSGGYVINGTKIYTTGSAEADYISVATLDPTVPGVAEKPVLGIRVFLVPKGTPGVTVHRDWDAVGQRATDSGAITFKDVKADESWVIRVPGAAPMIHPSVRYQAGFAALLIGIAVGALRNTIPFVNTKSRPWPSGGVDNAADDPYVRRLAGELTADLVAAYALTLQTGDLLDAFERGEIDRTSLAVPIYSAKVAAHRASLRACSEIYALMGTRSAARSNGFDRSWRDARVISLHDPVEWKCGEIGRHILSGWEPPPGRYQ